MNTEVIAALLAFPIGALIGFLIVHFLKRSK